VGAPSLRYIAHLNAPDLDIIGAGEPALPGVSFGHNAQMAWGITIFYIDQEDLYVYETKGDAYRYKAGFEPMKLVHETIAVKGEAPRDVVLKFTRHGPVLAETPDSGQGGHAFALRTVWSLPGASGYFGSSRLWRAKSWDDFKGGQEAWGAPPLNLVFADAGGDIGWSAAGLTPVRPNWDGLMPVPGDGRYEWAGMMPERQLPALHNPPRGFVATANQMNLPADYPAGHTTSYEWADRSRITRIEEVLKALPKATLADSMALQTDSHDALSRRVIALLRPLSSSDPEVARALDLLKAWDNDERTDSVAAAIYQVWATNHLGHTVVGAVTPEKARSLVGSGNLDAVITWLESPEAAASRNGLLLGSGALWLATQFGLSQAAYDTLVHLTGMPVPFRETGSFEILAWQFLWIIGMWIGAGQAAAQPVQPRPFPRWAVHAALVFVVVHLVWRHAVGQVPFPGNAALNALYDKWQLGPMRLLNFMALMLLAIYWAPLLSRSLPRWRALECLGRQSLPVFCAHLVLASFTLVSFGGADVRRPWLLDITILATCFAVLWAVALVSERIDRHAADARTRFSARRAARRRRRASAQPGH